MTTKRVAIACVSLLMGFLFVTTVFAVDQAAKDGIKKQVDDIVVAIDSGKKADDFKSAAKQEPYYVFIMEESGNLLVHPSLEGQSLKVKAEPVFDAVVKATPSGLWVDYEWQGKKKHTYVRETKSNLIVGSGYSE